MANENLNLWLEDLYGDTAGLKVKLRDCLGRALSRRDMDDVLERLEDLDRQSAEGVRRILRLLSKRQSRRKR